jgi:hypothetical protein
MYFIPSSFQMIQYRKKRNEVVTSGELHLLSALPAQTSHPDPLHFGGVKGKGMKQVNFINGNLGPRQLDLNAREKSPG